MDNKRLFILAGVAVLAILVAVVLLGRRAPEAEGSLVGQPVLPGLAERVNDIDTLRFVRSGERSLTLRRGESGWTVAERGGYAADPAKVRLAIINLGETRMLEPKTANPDRYAQLGVADPDAADGGGTLIEVSGGGVEHRLIAGHRAAGEGTYVRLPDQPQSLLATGDLAPDPEAGPWLQRSITDIPSSRVREIQLSRDDGAVLRVYKDSQDDDNFTVADVPRGREVQSAYIANGLASMLAGLSLDDVERDREDAHGDRPLHRGRYRLFDGIVVDVQGWQEPMSPEGNPGNAYIRLSASLDDALARERIEADLAAEQAAQDDESIEGDADDVPSEEEAVATDEDAASQPEIDAEARTSERLAELQAEVDAINARASGWIYRIPPYKFSNIDKRMDDMLASAD